MLKKIITLIICFYMLFTIANIALADLENELGQNSNEDYIEIYSLSDLSSITNDTSANYILMNDINMQDHNWIPIDFCGTFNGNNHTLYNVEIGEINQSPAISVDGNHKEYDTYFAALFAKTENATIINLNLYNIDYNIETDKNCFVAGLVGYSDNTSIINCSINGRIYLYMTNQMCGVSGIVGFGSGLLKDSSTDVILTLVDGNQQIDCEQFLGGALACGYVDIEGCDIKVEGYASVYGYVHNGGLNGMHHIHTRDKPRDGYVRDNTVYAIINFFEKSSSRRAYCKSFIGETLDAYDVVLKNNTEIFYEKNEDRTYSNVLLPEKVQKPLYEIEIVEPTCFQEGYTKYIFDSGNVVFKDNYTPATHTPGDWIEIKEANYTDNGLMTQSCLVCGETLQEKIALKLDYIYVSSCTLDKSSITVDYKSDTQLEVTVLPENAVNKNVIWTSSDDNIATVDQNGLIHAQGKGKVQILCSSEDGNSKSVCEVKVRYSFLQWLIIIFLFGWIWY